MEVSATSYFFNSEKPRAQPPITGPVPMSYQPVVLVNKTTTTDATILFTEYLIQSFLYAAHDSSFFFFFFHFIFFIIIIYIFFR